MTLVLPPDVIIEEIHAGVTRVSARADIYESDGTTLWFTNAPLIGGKVSISGTRDERRTASMTFENVNGVFSSDPDGFWYDKIIKLYRGVQTAVTLETSGLLLEDSNSLVTESGDQILLEGSGSIVNGTDWEIQLGEFFIDTIDASHFPHVVEVAARDRTKVLLKDKFAVSTSFPVNHPIEEIIRTIALNGNVPSDKINLPLTGKSTGRVFLFDHGTERWKAMRDIAQAYNYDLFFAADGTLTMEPFKDPSNPAVSPAEYRFETGPGTNRIANPGFETPLTGNATRAAGWKYGYQTTGAPTYALEKVRPYSEDNSLAITIPAGSSAVVPSNSVPVVAGEVWQISYAVRANAPITGSGIVYLRPDFSTVENVPLGDPSIVYGAFLDTFPEAGVTDWQVVSALVTVPAGKTFMQLAVVALDQGSTYTAYFDEVQAVKVSPLDSTQGNLAGFSKQTAEARLYNHIVVTGQASDQLPVVAQAENTNAASPTRIARIGRRTYFYTSSFIATQTQAQDVANRFLKIHALEQFEVNVEAIAVPYLDANIIVEFMDPMPTSAAPIRFLLSEVEIPLGLEPMRGVAKRVTIVG